MTTTPFRTSALALALGLAMAVTFLPRTALAAQQVQVRTRPAPAAPSPVDAEAKAEVARAVADLLEASYVKPDVGADMAALLRARASGDGWPEAATTTAFATALTRDLAEVAHDLHLAITAPGAGPLAGGPTRAVRRVVGGGGGPTPESPETRRRAHLDPGLPTSFRVPDGEEPPPLEDSPVAAQVAAERRVNHYLRRVEVLPGNVGYLDLDRFPIMPWAAPAADAAMSFLADVDAFILDLRGNPGGGEGMNQYLSSFFFGDDPVHLYSRFYAEEDVTREYWTVPDIPPVRLPDVPLYVLMDEGSGSAAENMAFSLGATGRAVRVGEATAGAGHSSTVAELPGGFSMVLPIARVFDPRTDADFEGTGVTPDVEAASADALPRAHALAMEELSARTDDPLRRQELAQAGALYAALSRPALDATDLADYAGAYGSRRVWVEGDRLMLQRIDVGDAPALPLLAVDDDAFVLEAVPEARIEFARGADGTVARIRVRLPSGAWEETDRGGEA